MNNRHRGDYFERQARDALAACGWYLIRSAGSFGLADLIALRDGNRPLLVSCKLNGYIAPTERAALMDAALAAGARGVVAMRPRAGWVELRTVQRGPGHKVIDELKVPPRKGSNNGA